MHTRKLLVRDSFKNIDHVHLNVISVKLYEYVISVKLIEPASPSGKPLAAVPGARGQCHSVTATATVAAPESSSST